MKKVFAEWMFRLLTSDGRCLIHVGALIGDGLRAAHLGHWDIQ